MSAKAGQKWISSAEYLESRPVDIDTEALEVLRNVMNEQGYYDADIVSQLAAFDNISDPNYRPSFATTVEEFFALRPMREDTKRQMDHVQSCRADGISEEAIVADLHQADAVWYGGHKLEVTDSMRHIHAHFQQLTGKTWFDLDAVDEDEIIVSGAIVTH